MEPLEVTLSKRGQITIPKAFRCAMGLKPGAILLICVEDGRLFVQKKVRLDLKRWIGFAEKDGLSTSEVISQLRGRQ
jgi:AbrB family looped-hinge helix DNA binding protein